MRRAPVPHSFAAPFALVLTLALLTGNGLMPAAAAQATPSAAPPLTGADRRAIVADIAAALADVYVFPEVAERMTQRLEEQLAAGAYDALADPGDLAGALTRDLRAVSKDLHLSVFAQPAPPPGAAGGEPSDAEQRERQARQVRRDNACFRELRHLTGNVGYLKLDCFASAELGGATAVAAMGFLAGSDALIFDLRENGGGEPSMIQLLTSYLLAPEPTHLNSFYVRKGDRTEQFWTHAWVPGARLPDVPVYVLTSGRTFSAAEEFTYNLKNLKRATIVGETTGGGAHPVDFRRIEGYPLVLSLPFGRAINPISGTNWEGTGVVPDVAVPAAEALRVAHERALGEIAERADDPQSRTHAEFVRGILADRGRATELPAERLADYAGNYGPRRVALESGGLIYRRGEGEPHRLTAVGEDRFLVGELDFFRIRFERDAAGRVVRLVGEYADGREEASARGDE